MHGDRLECESIYVPHMWEKRRSECTHWEEEKYNERGNNVLGI
jgi:hypothetical protein